jgi:hypothetical protein
MQHTGFDCSSRHEEIQRGGILLGGSIFATLSMIVQGLSALVGGTSY